MQMSAQVTPQPPQLFLSAPLIVVSQPSSGRPLQSARPSLQMRVHSPSIHLVTELKLDLYASSRGQWRPQAPQLSSSERKSTAQGNGLLGQVARPAGHVFDGHSPPKVELGSGELASA